MSRTRLEQIIMDLNLDNESEPTNPISRVIGKVRPHTRNTPGKEEIVERMREAIDVEVIGGSRREGAYAFRVSYEGRDPKTTMQVTSTLASMFIEENLKIREQYAEGTTEFLSSELDKAKKALEEQESAVRSFKEAHMGALPEQLDANLRTLDRLQMELQSVNDSLRNAKDRSALLEEQLGLGSAQSAIVANPVQEELLRLRQELVQLRTIFKENYPDVVIARSRINELEKELANRSATGGQESENLDEIDPAIQNPRLYSDLMSVKSQVVNLEKRGADIRKKIKLYAKRVEVIPANEQKLADLQRDHKISLESYQSLLEKKLNARLAENMEKRQKGERFRIIDPANLPEKPFKPNRVKVLALGILASTGGGVGLVFLLELLNPGFRKPEDFYGTLSQPVLASIPTFLLAPKDNIKNKLKVIRGRKEKRA
jgi:polysaccharide chain length determinant protein (PEP-CTERM system associated)